MTSSFITVAIIAEQHMHSADTNPSTVSRARVTCVTAHIHPLKPTLQLSLVTRVTFSDDYYELQDTNRDMHSAETNPSTVSRARSHMRTGQDLLLSLQNNTYIPQETNPSTVSRARVTCVTANIHLDNRPIVI
jgi:hypothetical protein